MPPPVVRAMRLPFLVLTPVCVFLGASVAHTQGVEIDPYLLTLILIGALLAHTSVNTLNEYLDFKSGLDLTTQRTPFSGGSGALPDSPHAAGSVKLLGLISLTGTALIGLYFSWHAGPQIIPIGVIGLLIIGAYTGWINRHPLICLISPGLGFGILMVVGTQFVLTGEFLMSTLLVALVPFFLVNNLLLLNQYPDLVADEQIGRRHFPIRYGIAASNRVYALFTGATAIAITGYAFVGLTPTVSLVALLPLSLSVMAWRGALQHGKNIGSYPRFLGLNVGATLLTPFALALSLTIS